MKQPREGSVLRVTEWNISYRNVFDKPRWCLVLEVGDRDNIFVDWLVGDPPVVDSGYRNDVVVPNSPTHGGDKFEIVPEEEWPGEVCAALAKRALL